MPYTNNKGADQPAHPRNLIRTFVFHCLDSLIPLVSKSEISSPYIATVAAQASLSLPWSQTPKTDFLVMRLNFSFSEYDPLMKPCDMEHLSQGRVLFTSQPLKIF